MNSLRRFTLGLAITFGLPWLVLVVVPTFKHASIGAMVYEDADGNQKYFPESTVFTNGQLVYQAEGCVTCHTQMIRPMYAGFDGQRKGWGKDQEKRPSLTRPSEARDYLRESYAYLGVQRNGPDLSNVGYRIADEKWHHAHLYDPRAVHAWSTNLLSVTFTGSRKSRGPDRRTPWRRKAAMSMSPARVPVPSCSIYFL